MPQRPLSVILLVIGTMAGVVALYACAMFWLCIQKGNLELATTALGQFKDFAIFAGGALSGFLARTSTHDAADVPTPVVVTNTPENPAATHETNPTP